MHNDVMRETVQQGKNDMDATKTLISAVGSQETYHSQWRKLTQLFITRAMSQASQRVRKVAIVGSRAVGTSRLVNSTTSSCDHR
jgi:hypothetical protein